MVFGFGLAGNYRAITDQPTGDIISNGGRFVKWIRQKWLGFLDLFTIVNSQSKFHSGEAVEITIGSGRNLHRERDDSAVKTRKKYSEMRLFE